MQGEAYSLELLRKQFAALNADGSGKLDATELLAAMEVGQRRGDAVVVVCYM